MALTFDNVVDRAVAMFGSENQATIVSFANERQGRMVSEAAFRTVVTSITTTVVDQDTYNAPADLVDLRAIRIGTEAEAIPRVSLEDIWALQAGGSLEGADSVFAATYDSNGVLQLVLYPAPGTTGDTIYGIESLHPSDGAYGTSYATILPKSVRPFWLDGVLADCYIQLDERPDLADAHEARFEAGVERLRRLKNSRVGGPVSGIRLRATAP